MAEDHPLSDPEHFKSAIKAKRIVYTKHFEEERLPYRENVSKELIEENLENPENLDEFVHVDDEHRREKYEALFDKSSKYYLKVVLSMNNGKIFIVTAHVINKTKKRRSQMLG